MCDHSCAHPSPLACIHLCVALPWPCLGLACTLVCGRMTTVGYGDFSPQSEVGRVITAVAMCLGLCFTAMPLAIVGNTFSTAWDARALSVIREQVRPTIAPPQPFLSALMPPLSDVALLLLVVYSWYTRGILVVLVHGSRSVHTVDGLRRALLGLCHPTSDAFVAHTPRRTYAACAAQAPSARKGPQRQLVRAGLRRLRPRP